MSPTYSPSVLHYTEAIEHRYKQLFMKWMEADEIMNFAARPDDECGRKFQIGAVVPYVKLTFFSKE
jgi:hypothetical protein